MNKLWFALPLLALSLWACETERSTTKEGDLVPLTVEDDLNLPSIAVNGTQLHAETFGNPAHPMLVFLHGGPGGDYLNGMKVKALADDGFYVVFYDQRGSGLSKRHDKNTYSVQLMLDDLTAVIEHYRTSADQEVFLFGHSWGAMLTAAYLNAYPDRIDGAIFAEAGGFNKELLDDYGASSRNFQLLNEEANDIFYLDQFVTGGENDHAALDYKLSLITPFAYHEDNDEGVEGPSPFNRYGAVTLSSFTDIAENEGFDFTPNLDQYTIKVLFLYGELNRSYGLDFAQREAAFFPNAEIVQINDTGHEMIYFKWDSVYPVVLDYLTSL